MKTSTPFIKRWAQALWIGALALCPVAVKAQYWADANNDGILDYCITITPGSRVQVGFDPECCGKEYSVTYQFWGSANTHYYIQGYAGGQWHILNYLCLTNADLVTANWPEGQTCDTYGSYRCVALGAPVFELSTQTEATTPSNRARKRIGVGERVSVSLPPGHSGPVNWQAPDGGTLQNAGSSTVEYVAPDTEGSRRVTASGNGNNYEVTFDVIKPSGVLLRQWPNSNIIHTHNPREVMFKAEIYILPSDVSFVNVEVIEGGVAAVTTGYFSYRSGEQHTPGTDWMPGHSVTSNVGTLINAFDVVRTGSVPPPYDFGTFTWNIPWSYRVGNGSSRAISTVIHEQVITTGGALTLEKGGFSVTRTPDSPEVTNF